MQKIQYFNISYIELTMLRINLILQQMTVKFLLVQINTKPEAIISQMFQRARKGYVWYPSILV